MFVHKRLVILVGTLTLIYQMVFAMENWDGLLNDDAYDTSNWINPNDMGFEPKPLKVTVMKKPAVKEINITPSNLEVRAETMTNEDDKANPSNTPAQLKNISCECEKKVIPQSMEDTFTYRHVKNLLNILSLNDGNTMDVYKFDLSVQLSRSQLSKLQQFVGDQSVKKTSKERLGQMHDIDSILNSFIVSVQKTREYDLSDLAQDYTSTLKQYLPNSSQDIFWCILFCAGLTLFYLMWIGIPIWKLFVFMLVISSLWHWGHMYKKAVLKKHMALMESHNVPHECFKEKSWKDYFFGDSKKCQDHHSALLVDPLWEVTPTMAIAETLTMLVVQPMEQIGSHLGKFFSSLLANLSWLSALPVLVFVFLVIFVIIIMMCNYKIRLPFLLASIEPQTRAELPHQTLHLEKKIQELQMTISHMKDSREAVTSSALSLKQVASDSSDTIQNCQQTVSPPETVFKAADNVSQTVVAQPAKKLSSEESKLSLLEQKIEQLHSTICKLELIKRVEATTEDTKDSSNDSAPDNFPATTPEIDQVSPTRQSLSKLCLSPEVANSSKENIDKPEPVEEETNQEAKTNDNITEEPNGCDFEWVNS